MIMDENMRPTPNQQGYKSGTAAKFSGTKYQDKSDAIHKGALGHDVALLVAALIRVGKIASGGEAVDVYIRMKKHMYEKDKSV